MTENVVGDGDRPTGATRTDEGTLSLNSVSDGQTFNGINADVESYLVGNVNITDDSGNGNGTQVADTGQPVNPASNSTGDMYDYSGDTGTGNPTVRTDTTESGTEVAGTKVTVGEGQTLWGIIGEHYNGKYPLEAVYAANNMEPRVVDNNGKKELVDPIYHVGDEFVLPPEDQIDALTQKYRDRVNELGKNSEERVGGADAASEVKLIYGDTLWALAAKKYGTDNPPLAAIYEANNMTPQVVEKDGQTELVAPTYYAGQTFTLPAASEVADLEKKFWQRMGRENPDQPDPAPGPGQGTDTDTPDPYDYSGSPEDGNPGGTPPDDPNADPNPDTPPQNRTDLPPNTRY